MPIAPQAVQAAADQADLWKAAIPAVTGLLGVLVGGGIQMFSAARLARMQRRDRQEDDQAERARVAARDEADRSYARALLARHLEAYARACAEVMWKNGSAEGDEELATDLPEFHEWPAVAWELLGAKEAMKARDIEVRVDIQKSGVNAGVYYAAGTPGEARSYYEDAAARVGLEAWTLARQMREEAHVEPFEFPRGGGNFAEALADHVAKIDEAERVANERREARRAARLAAGEEDDPFD